MPVHARMRGVHTEQVDHLWGWASGPFHLWFLDRVSHWSGTSSLYSFLLVGHSESPLPPFFHSPNQAMPLL